MQVGQQYLTSSLLTKYAYFVSICTSSLKLSFSCKQYNCTSMEIAGWPFSPAVIMTLAIPLRQKNCLRDCVCKCISGRLSSFIAVRKHTGIFHLLDKKDDASMRKAYESYPSKTRK